MTSPKNAILDKRRAGVLLHPTSLPSSDLGPDAERFLDFMQTAGLSVWQMLPLGPTHADGSPYHCLSVHAISPALVSLGRLVESGWLKQAPVVGDAAARRAALVEARAGLGAGDRSAFERFCHDQEAWLDNYTLYRALREEHEERPWWQWEPALRAREPKALADAEARLAERRMELRFEQFAAASQWQMLRAEARRRGILLFGDMPIFVAHDSAEVWAQPERFKLDAVGQPRVVAGVPPDYFSRDGQRWGNPIYDWDFMRAHGFSWWVARMATELSRFDLVRIDHFRGFEACWEIPASQPTAVNGQWIKAPGEAIFDTFLTRFGKLPLAAEDLGLITPEVEMLRDRYGLPGMSVLQFAFEGDADNPYLLHNIEANRVVYTGTHDNDTTLGWFEQLDASKQQRVREYLGNRDEPMPWALTRAALMSVGRWAVVPMQDLLGLGSAHRMNRPGTNAGNWAWKFVWPNVPQDLASRVRQLIELYGRSPAEKTAPHP
jgi:4-alpha-glucanotransferase